MKSLYESILDIDIANKANQNIDELIQYCDNLKKMYDIFWKGFPKILKKYDIKNPDIGEINNKTTDYTLFRNIAIFYFNHILKNKDDFANDCKDLFISSYTKAFKKKPGNNISIDKDTLKIDFYCDNDELTRMSRCHVIIDNKAYPKFRLGGLKFQRVTSKSDEVNISLRYIKLKI